MRFIKKLCVLAMVCVLLVSIQFSWWLFSIGQELNRHSQVIETAMGPIEYAKIGKGPVVIVVHGEGGGYDTLNVYAQLAKDGFTVICPSRPGYLRTPVGTAVTFSKQADLILSLIEALEISDKVGVIGVSLGGPVALQIAMRYPDRVAALVLQNAVSYQDMSAKEQKDLFLDPLFLSSNPNHVMSWIYYHWAHWFPVEALTAVVQQSSFSSIKYASQFATNMISTAYQKQAFFNFIKRQTPLSYRRLGLQTDVTLLKTRSQASLEKIKAPTLVLHSQTDRKVSVLHGQYSYHSIPGAMAYFFESNQGDGLGQLFFMSEQWPYIYTAMKGFLTVSLP